MSSIKKAPTKKPKKIAFPSFRLFDFATYDYYETKENDENSNSTNSTSKSDKNKSRKNQEYQKKQSNFRIEMYGLNEKGETCVIFVEDMQPFFFVKVGDNWTNEVLSEFRKYLHEVLKTNKNGLLEMTLVDYNKLYGFSSGKTSKFVRLTFANMMVFNKIRNLWFQQDRGRKQVVFQKTVLELYESKIPRRRQENNLYV